MHRNQFLFLMVFFRLKFFLLFTLLCACGSFLMAQSVTRVSSDTMRSIQIIQGRSLREKTLDSDNVIETIAGNVILKQDSTLFDCDSAVLYGSTNIIEAFGNVHINQDTINTYSQYLKYIGNDHMAYLKNNVKLMEKKAVLYTQDLQYDLKSNVGNYSNGGKVINGTTVLTSDSGTYYADTKDVYFKNNVHLVDPKYDIVTDSLLYNSQTQLTTFITSTFIKSKNGGDIYTTQGTYDLSTGKAFFGNRSIIKDSGRIYVANNSAYDEKTGIAQLEGNAVVKDSANGYTVIGNQIYFNKQTNSFLATRKPVLILYGNGNDSTFIAADTLFSGIVKKDSLQQDSAMLNDSTNQQKTENLISLSDVIKNVALLNPLDTNIYKKDSSINYLVRAQPGVTKIISNPTVIHSLNKKDSITAAKIISASHKLNLPGAVHQDSTVQKLSKDSVSTIAKIDSAHHLIDSSIARSTLKDSTIKTDTLKNTTAVNVTSDTALRYFQAFHNVRIYSDSMQAVCDSLYYTTIDSMFRMYNQPLLFANHSQISGDTMYLYTKNRKPQRLYVFYNGMIIEQTDSPLYNQMSGRTINGYFKNGQMDYMRVKGLPAESIYYPQNDDSAYIGMNRGTGDVIDIFFEDRQVHKVKFINNVDGTLYPMRQIPADQKFLKGFEWLDKRRPKSKIELFE